MYFKIIPNEQTPITPIIDDVNEFIEQNKVELLEFLEFTNRQSNCAGLASNQCSIKYTLEGEEKRFEKRVFVLIDQETKMGKLIINPVITEYIGWKRLMNEGCLTWDKKRIIMERYVAVKVSYYLIDGTKVENEYHLGFSAQVWQHEIDHLNGREQRIEQFDFRLPKNEPERNASCPCGSGKKFKKCCLIIE